MTTDVLRRWAVGGLLAIILFFVIEEVVARAGSDVPPGLVVLGLSFVAVVLFGVWKRTRIGVLVWLTAALFSVSANQMGANGIDRLAFLALAAGWFIGVTTNRQPLRRFRLPEALMTLFVVVQIVSYIVPHELESSTSVAASSYISNGILLPLAGYVIASQSMADGASVRLFAWFVVGVGIYLGMTAIFQKFGLDALVFPRVILDDGAGVNPERPRGPLLNSAADGILMTFALAMALFLGQQRDLRYRWVALVTALMLPVAIFATQTRAIFLGGAVVVVGGALFARGYRRWHLILMGTAVAVVAINFKKFISDDRTQGGVASVSEIDSRLNDWATAIWGVIEKPAFGWGIGRFTELNTLHHQAWPGVAWKWGFGYISHNTYLAYAAEIGFIGLFLWLAILVSIALRTRLAWHLLPRRGVVSRGFVLAFWLSMASWAVNATFIDVRVFLALTAFLFVWAGIISGLADRSEAELAAMDDPPRARVREPVGIPHALLTPDETPAQAPSPT